MIYASDTIMKFDRLKKEKKHIELMSLIAEENGGELLSKEFTGWNSKYEFLLKKGDLSTRFFRSYAIIASSKNYQYAFPKSVDNVIRKNECKEKKFNRFKSKVEDLGGILLENKWLGCSVKHKIRLFDEEISLTPKEVNRSGLATPSRGLITEPILRQVLEHLFGYKFSKTRNLLNKKMAGTKSALELDGYCPELNIAFEYQGHPSHWKKEDPRFAETKKYDELKMQLCKKLGITLLIFDNIKHKNYTDSDFYMRIVLDKIKETFSKNNVGIPQMNVKEFKINLSKTNHYHQSFQNLKTKAEESGYELLDNEWKGTEHLYTFKHLETGTELKLTSLRVNNSKRGFPKNIHKYVNHTQSLNKDNQLNRFKNTIEKNGFILIDKEWKNVEHLMKIQHSITKEIINVKPSNVFYSKDSLGRKYKEMLK